MASCSVDGWVNQREPKQEVVSPTATLEAINTQLREELRCERERAAGIQRQQGAQLADMQQKLCGAQTASNATRGHTPGTRT